MWLPLGHRPDGTPFGIPVIVVHGAKPGKRLGITAAVHGDTYEGPHGVRQFLSELDPAELAGTIIATPQANPLAFETFSHSSAVDNQDLNRNFPGRSDGSVTQRMAHLITTEIIARVDYHIDIQGGGANLAFGPFTAFNSAPGPVGEASLALAKAFGLEYLHGSTSFPNVLRLEAAKRNVPAILVEIGGMGRLDADFLQQTVAGLHNVARHLGLVLGTPALRSQYKVTKSPPCGDFMLSPSGGFLVVHVEMGADVVDGQHLATLIDVFGAEVARVHAQNDGVFLGYRSIPVTRPGDRVCSVLPVATVITADTTLADIAPALEVDAR